jgi:hypothetical protein
MKSIVLAFVFCAGGVWGADEVADREAIQKTVAQLGVLPQRADLFTADFDGRAELAGLRGVTCPPEVKGPLCSAMGLPMPAGDTAYEVVISKEPWGEATISRSRTVMVVKNIRFLTPEVAMVDAVGKTPLLILLKKEGTDWKIASLRMLAEK